MTRCKYRHIVFVAAAALFTLYFVFRTADNFSLKLARSTSPLKPACSIPELDPYDLTIRHLVHKGKPIKCNAMPPLTYVDKTWLRFNLTILKKHYDKKLVRCQYQTITREGEGLTDDEYAEGGWVIKVDMKDVQISAEFIFIACFKKDGKLLYENFHAFVQEKAATEVRASRQFEAFYRLQNPDETLSVLAIGVDSMSRSNMIRQLPKTRAFLHETKQAIEMYGFNKVGDNTFLCLVPMLSGRHVEELPWSAMGKSGNAPFDKYNIIWKLFSSHGYRTLYAEDAPYGATFNHLKKGFYIQPTDYYLRPLSLAMENQHSIWRNNHHCIGSKLETEFVLDWVQDFHVRFRNKPRFSFAFLTRMTHDEINNAAAVDDSYYRFFKTLFDENALNDTVVFFFSDHGIRFGEIREYYVGKVEERLPGVFVAFPKWFQKKYPDLMKNIRTNQHRLTTAFDIHETLKDLSNFHAKEIKNRKTGLKRGISLFNEVSHMRTCETAGIAPHWCTCFSEKTLELTTSIVKEAATALVRYINGEIDQGQTGKCAYLTLDKVMTARELTHDGKTFLSDSTSFSVYQLIIRTIPCNGVFEGTLGYDGTTSNFKILGDISRISKYGNMSICVGNLHLEKFCCCR